MAALDLTVHPTLVIAQGAVFLAAIFLIYHLFILPYLALKDKRDHLTNKDSSDAKAIKHELDDKKQKVSEAFALAQKYIKDKRDQQKKRHEQLRRQTSEQIAKDTEAFLESKKKELTFSLEQAAKDANRVLLESSKAVLNELGLS